MSKIKLEVGKTYLSREGKEVTIVGNNDRVEYPCTGNNGQWYTESGRYHYDVPESPYDLIEEVTRHTFKIPNGTKEVTVEQVSNRIIVEMVPEAKGPKRGDVMVNDIGSVYIFKSAWGNGESHKPFAYVGATGKLFFSGWCSPGRPATPEEAQPLWDALKKAGKRWNPETMKVEDVSEFERILEWVETRAAEGNYNHKQLCWLIEEYLKHKEDKKEDL